MPTRDDILALVKKNGTVKSGDLVRAFTFSRQYAALLLRTLVAEGTLVKTGSTRGAVYMLPGHAVNGKEIYRKKLLNRDLKEHLILDDIRRTPGFTMLLPENVQSIFAYAFSEMLNNAIEHSQSTSVEVQVANTDDLVFSIRDTGIGVFRNIMRKRNLQSELEAVQDLLKGKTTTAPEAHSGEGIFFTSKIADVFTLESYGHRLTVDNRIEDIFIEQAAPPKKGTLVTFRIAATSPKHLNDIFRKYQTNPGEYAFDKTEIQVKLYTIGTIHVSRSQARRVLAGLEKFQTIILDFAHVPTVGQAFADEIFRVFKHRHPSIDLQPINMNEAVAFMVGRVGN